jgi:hypothetical protein
MFESIRSCTECLQNDCKFLVFDKTTVCTDSRRVVSGAASIIPRGKIVLFNYLIKVYLNVYFVKFKVLGYTAQSTASAFPSQLGK